MRDLLNKMNKLNENKNGKVITFDFDNTIVKSFENNSDGIEIQYQFGGLNHQIIARMKKFKKQGYTVLVVTSRNVAREVPESSVQTMLKQLDLEVDGIFYTNEERKARKLYELGSSLHYDDDPREHEAIQAYSKLHQDFNITVRYPDELLSDIEEISKGIIVTADNKFVIVQRSDSYEWDAAGGHLMEGEEPAYAFWREVKEEMSIAIKNIQHMDTRDTTWKGKDKLVHYFLANIDYTSEELKDAVDLQWELADYFCGDIKEIDEKLSSTEGATQNLKNTVDIFLNQGDLLLEMKDYQKKMFDRHDDMKKRILGMGPEDKPPADGIENVKDWERSESAPPIGAAMGEGKEKKMEKKINIRITSELDEKKKKKKKKKRRKGKKPGPKPGSKKQRKPKSSGIGWPYVFGGGERSSEGGDFGDGGGDGG